MINFFLSATKKAFWHDQQIHRFCSHQGKKKTNRWQKKVWMYILSSMEEIDFNQSIYILAFKKTNNSSYRQFMYFFFFLSFATVNKTKDSICVLHLSFFDQKINHYEIIEFRKISHVTSIISIFLLFRGGFIRSDFLNYQHYSNPSISSDFVRDINKHESSTKAFVPKMRHRWSSLHRTNVNYVIRSISISIRSIWTRQCYI